MRLIDADKVVKDLQLVLEMTDKTDWKETQMEVQMLVQPIIGGFVNYIAELPTIETPEVKHGHWSRMIGDTEEDGFYDKIVCSVCHMEAPFYVKSLTGRQERTAYCPNCGAKMREEQNDE